MIRINKNADSNDLSSYPDYLVTDTFKKLLNFITKKTDEINYKNDDIFLRLNTLYSNKCGYCEIKEHNAPLQIEHYRPKKRDHRKNDFDGYRWLSLEWTNLLLSCSYCNSAKGDDFPLPDSRNRKIDYNEFINSNNEIDFSKTHINSNLLMSESPYLINPEVDNPDDFFIFTKDGQIQEKNNEIRGKKTIYHIDINSDRLIKKRKGIIDRLINKMYKYLDKINISNPSEIELLRIPFSVLFEEVDESIAPHYEFSGFRKYINDDFTNILETKLIPEAKQIVLELYIKYQAGTL